MKFIWASFFVIFFFASCKQVEDDFHEENFPEQLSSIQKIIDDIRNFDPHEIEQNFFSQIVPGNGPIRVFFLGEVHNHLDGILKNWGLVNYLSQNKSIVLLEGISRKQEASFGMSIYKIFDLYWIKEWLKLNKPYESSEVDAWIAKRYTNMPIFDLIHNLNFVGLHQTAFGFWDNKKALELKSIDFKFIEKRNESMAKAIKERILENPNRLVVIVAGYAHLPLGEYLKDNWALGGELNENIEEKYERHYQNMAYLHNLFPKKSDYGSTEVVYRALKNAGLGFFQAIPKSSFLYHNGL